MANQITPNPSVPSQVVAEVKFPKFINNLGIIPTSYKDSMSYYECLAWLCKFLEEQVIPTVNENGEAVEELQALYVELNSYVTHYFDTLDVQEEINNKLDDMVEAGTLQEIIADYLNSKAIFGYDSVADMKNATNLIDGSYAKTLGFYTKNDGGSALYKIRTITNDDVVDNMFIIGLNEQNNLIAELIFNNLNIKTVGAYGDNIHNDTQIINKSAEFLYNKGGGTLIFPIGEYLIDYFKLYPYVNIEGENNFKTKFIPSLSANEKLFYMEVNPIRNITIENFSIVNSNNINNLIGIDLTSIPSTVSPYNGGIWHSNFNNITITNFKIGLKLEAIDNTGDEANQFLNFFKVCIYRKGISEDERCAVINQQLGQTIFDSCMFESTNQGQEQYNLGLGINVDIGSTISIGDSDIACLLFNNCTFQNSLQNILLNSRGVTIRDSWFENIGKAITLYNNANLNLYNNRFANACYVGDGTGYVVKIAINSFLKCYDNFITGSRAEHFIEGNKNARLLTLKNNYVPLATTSSQIVRQAGVSSENSIDARGENILYVGTSDNELRTITSFLSAGEELTIIVGGGATNGQSLKITYGGNIQLRNDDPIILHTYDSVTLIKQDLLGTNWWVKSVNKLKYKSAVIPSSNNSFASTYFLKGDIIYNLNPSLNNPIGWECISSGTPGTWASIGNYE